MTHVMGSGGGPTLVHFIVQQVNNRIERALRVRAHNAWIIDEIDLNEVDFDRIISTASAECLEALDPLEFKLALEHSAKLIGEDEVSYWIGEMPKYEAEELWEIAMGPGRNSVNWAGGW